MRFWQMIIGIKIGVKIKLNFNAEVRIANRIREVIQTSAKSNKMAQELVSFLFFLYRK